MNSLRVERTDAPGLEFEGTLVARSEGEHVESALGKRWYNLFLYAKSGGGFVPGIEFHTTCPGERPVSIAEIVDDFTDVENFFLVHEPNEYIRDSASHLRSRDNRHQLLRHMYQVYDWQVTQIFNALREVPERLDVPAENALSDTTSPPRRNWLLSLLGRK
jgi:hypothetical protein